MSSSSKNSIGTWFPTMGSCSGSCTATTKQEKIPTGRGGLHGALFCAVPNSSWLVSHGGRRGTFASVPSPVDYQINRAVTFFGETVRVMDLSRGGQHRKQNGTAAAAAATDGDDENAFFTSLPMPWSDYPVVRNNNHDGNENPPICLQRYGHSGFVRANQTEAAAAAATEEGENRIVWQPVDLLRRHSLVIHGGVGTDGEVLSDILVFDFGTGMWSSSRPEEKIKGALAPKMYGHQAVQTFATDRHTVEADGFLLQDALFVVGINERLAANAKRDRIVNVQGTNHRSLAVYVQTELRGWNELMIIADFATTLAPRRNFRLAEYHHHPRQQHAAPFVGESSTFFLVGGVIQPDTYSRRYDRDPAQDRDMGTHHEVPVVEMVWHRDHSTAANKLGQHVVCRTVLGPWSFSGTGSVPATPPTSLFENSNMILSNAVSRVRSFYVQLQGALAQRTGQLTNSGGGAISGVVVHPVDFCCFGYDEALLVELLRLAEHQQQEKDVVQNISGWLEARNAATVRAFVGGDEEDDELHDDEDDHDDDDSDEGNAARNKAGKKKIANIRLRQWEKAKIFFVFSSLFIDVFALVPTDEEVAFQKEQQLSAAGAALPQKNNAVLAPLYVPLAIIPMKCGGGGANNGDSQAAGVDVTASILRRLATPMESICLSTLPHGARVLCSAQRSNESRVVLAADSRREQPAQQEPVFAIYGFDSHASVDVTVATRDRAALLGQGMLKNFNVQQQQQQQENHYEGGEEEEQPSQQKKKKHASKKSKR